MTQSPKRRTRNGGSEVERKKVGKKCLSTSNCLWFTKSRMTISNHARRLLRALFIADFTYILDSTFHQFPRLSPSPLDEPKYDVSVMAEIAIPGVRRVPQTCRDDDKPGKSNLELAVFKRSSAYIRYSHPTEEELDSKNMYDVDRCVVLSSAWMNLF